MVLNGQLAKDLGGDPVAAVLFSFTACAVSIGIYSHLRSLQSYSQFLVRHGQSVDRVKHSIDHLKKLTFNIEGEVFLSILSVNK